MKSRFIILFIFCNVLGYGQKVNYWFQKINTSNGLSHNQVNAILKDVHGYLWFGTMSGLNKYDGCSIKVFKRKLDDSSSLKDNNIASLASLPNGNMWVMTSYGASIFDPVTEKFNSEIAKYQLSLGLPQGEIVKIQDDRQGHFWFLYETGDLYYLDEMAMIVRQVYRNESFEKERISTFQVLNESQVWIVFSDGLLGLLDIEKNKIVKQCSVIKNQNPGGIQYNIFIDADGDLWVWYYLGNVYCVRPDDNTLLWVSDKSFSSRISSNLLSQLVQDNEGKIWIGADHGGVTTIDKENNFGTTYVFSDPLNLKSLSQNSITTVYKDDAGIIWLGTYKQGVNFYNSSILQFPLFHHQEIKENSLQYDDINRFAEDKFGNIWIGTNGGGLIYFNREKNLFKQFLHDKQNDNSISSNVIVSLWVDHKNNLWIGTFTGGLDMYDGQRFYHYKHVENDVNSLSNNNVWEIFEDRSHRMWIGTLGGGVNLFRPELGKFEHLRADDKEAKLPSDLITALMQDRNDHIWVGTNNGIAVFDTKQSIIARYSHTDDKGSLSHNNVICMLEDHKGQVWIGTTEGLNVFNPTTRRFQSFTMNYGLPDNVILNILEDEKHSFWVSTPKGLCNIFPETTAGGMTITVINYDEMNNLQSQEFNDNAAFRTKRNELFFGGPSGFNIITPSLISTEQTNPKIVFSQFQVLNKNIEPGEMVNDRVLLTESISVAKEINLKYKENVFTIEFALLSYSHSIKDKYAYMLQGFNDTWILTDGHERRVTYTNLDPGKYTFMVKFMNRNGVWSEVKKLEIRISPPFWRSTVAYILYFLFITSVVLLARKLALDRIHMRYEVAEQKREAERTHLIEQVKTKFFTNVSHEFRTPLSLIIAPLDKMIKQAANEDQKAQLNLVQRNAKRLLGLVNQLLDFRKIQVQEMKFNPSFGDIIGFTREIGQSFLDIAEKKNIEYSYATDIEELGVYFDKDKLEKILFNLLSNAFKYTNHFGKVDLIVSHSHHADSPIEETITIEVRDTGIGVAPEFHEKIFERYFQTDLSGTLVNQGTGIGLAITKEFVKLHKGVISIKSEPDKGTSFIVTLPVIKAIEEGGTGGLSSTFPIDSEETDAVVDSTRHEARRQKRIILLVEDNEDMLFYLKDNLKGHYQVLEAINGRVGWEKVKHYMPDLVVSDIMMPEMNGIELAKRIKSDTHTSHIPVILLTAIGDEEKQLEGLKIGVNDYITKPFSFEILASRIRNIISLQKLIHKRFQKQVEVNPKEIAITPVDEKFLQDALRIVEENMGNSDFSIEDLSKGLYMNRVTLYRKLLSITGKTPIEFLRSVRLKRAASLLTKSGKTISEIAFETGFSSTKKFTLHFKEEYNELPSQYAKRSAGRIEE